MYILLIGLFLGIVPDRKEWLGLFLAIVGCVFIIMDPKALRIESSERPEVE